jgi:hypothetical protein
MYSSEGATLSDWTGTCRYSAARFAVSAVIGQRGRGRSSSRTLHRRPSSIVYRACMRTKRSEADRRIGFRFSARIARVGWPEASDSYARRRGFLPVRRCVFASQLASSDAPGLDSIVPVLAVAVAERPRVRPAGSASWPRRQAGRSRIFPVCVCSRFTVRPACCLNGTPPVLQSAVCPAYLMIGVLRRMVTVEPVRTVRQCLCLAFVALSTTH